jgi:hypothetical protein
MQKYQWEIRKRPPPRACCCSPFIGQVIISAAGGALVEALTEMTPVVFLMLSAEAHITPVESGEAKQSAPVAAMVALQVVPGPPEFTAID